jgi:L-rhamnose isomerase
VWDAYCLRQDVPVGFGFVDEIRAYEEQVLSQRA